MIALSSHFWAPAAALLATAALPVWMQWARGSIFDPCANPSALERLAAFGATHSPLNLWRTESERYPLAVAGEFTPSRTGSNPVRFWVVKTFVPFDFYGRPDSLVTSVQLPEDREELHALSVGSDALPVHRRYDDSLGVVRFSQYLLIQGTRPVRHPLPGGLAHVLPQLLHGTEPVTMFALQIFVDARDLSQAEAEADAWMAKAWRDFRGACLP